MPRLPFAVSSAADRNSMGDRKGRPYRRVPSMTPMADRTGDCKDHPPTGCDSHLGISLDGNLHAVTGVVHIAFEVPDVRQVHRLGIPCGVEGTHHQLMAPRREAAGRLPETPHPLLRWAGEYWRPLPTLKPEMGVVQSFAGLPNVSREAAKKQKADSLDKTSQASQNMKRGCTGLCRRQRSVRQCASKTKQRPPKKSGSFCVN